MPTEKTPGPDLSPQRARQARTLKLIIGFLLLSAAAFAFLFTRIALPLRLFVAATDITLAAVLWLLLHQTFRK